MAAIRTLQKILFQCWIAQRIKSTSIHNGGQSFPHHLEHASQLFNRELCNNIHLQEKCHSRKNCSLREDIFWLRSKIMVRGKEEIKPRPILSGYICVWRDSLTYAWMRKTTGSDLAFKDFGIWLMNYDQCIQGHASVLCPETSLIYLMITLLCYTQYSRHSKANCISFRRHLTAERNETLGKLLGNNHQSRETVGIV